MQFVIAAFVVKIFWGFLKEIQNVKILSLRTGGAIEEQKISFGYRKEIWFYVRELYIS